MIKSLLLVLGILSFVVVRADCPVSSELWRQVEELRSANLEPESEIRLLLKLRSQRVACSILNDSSYVNLLQRLGAVYFGMDNYDLAKEYTAQAIQIGSAGLASLKPGMLAKSYFNYAMICQMSNESDKAAAAFDSSIVYALRYPEYKSFATRSYKSLSVNYYFRGDFQRSVIYARKATVLAAEENDRFMEALAMCEEALALEAMMKYVEAGKVITQAIKIYRETLAQFTPGPSDLEELANLYSAHGNILRKLGKPHEAISNFQNAFAIYQKTEHNNGRFLALNNIGYNYLHALANYTKAVEYFQKSFAYSSGYNDSIHIFTNLGDVFLKKGDPLKALTMYQRGLKTIPANARLTHLKDNPGIEILRACSQKEYIVSLLVQKGKAWVALKGVDGNTPELNNALATFALADSLVDQMMFEQEANESKFIWRDKAHSLYEQAIEVCNRLKAPEKAFFYFEKSRSVVLNQELERMSLLFQKGRGSIREHASLTKELNAKKRQLQNLKQEDPAYPQLVNEIFGLTQQLDISTRNIRKSDPAFYQLFLESEIPDLTKVRRRFLKDYESIVEIFEGDSAVFLLMITNDATSLRKLNKIYYDSLVAKFVEYCSSPAKTNANFKEFSEVSHSLYVLMFADLPIKPGRLIISPDSKFIPFEALITEIRTGRPKYMVEDFALSYPFSLKAMISPTPTRAVRARHFLGMAPVNYSNTMHLAALPQSDQSLMQVSQYFESSNSYFGQDATKANFVKSFPDYRVIQLYTHAAESSSFDEPVIYFADSALYLSDLIIDKPLAAQLVVLSACETALGKLSRGEGVFSFSRGFAAIGIPASLANLWEVDNKSMYDLTERFYKHLANGLSKDVAMQTAKIEFLANASKETSLPYYWAATILSGDATPITFKQPLSTVAFLLYAATAIVLAILLFFLYRFLTHKNKKSFPRTIHRGEAGIETLGHPSSG